MKKMIAALAACVLLPAAAQSTSYTPTEREAQQARDNAARDAKLADTMEKARLKEEAKPVAAYIPKEKAAEKVAEHKIEVFTARAPGDKKKPAKKKKRA
jgi:5-deoxy-D-glucuronate isomerase